MNKVLEQDLDAIIQENISWEKLKGKTVLITGASGMIGSYMLYVLTKLNDDYQYGIYSSLLEVRLSFQTFECGCQNLVHNCKGSQNKTLVGGQYYFKYAKSMVFLFATLSKAYLLTSQSDNFWCVVYIL